MEDPSASKDRLIIRRRVESGQESVPVPPASTKAKRAGRPRSLENSATPCQKGASFRLQIPSSRLRRLFLLLRTPSFHLDSASFPLDGVSSCRDASSSQLDGFFSHLDDAFSCLYAASSYIDGPLFLLDDSLLQRTKRLGGMWHRPGAVCLHLGRSLERLTVVGKHPRMGGSYLGQRRVHLGRVLLHSGHKRRHETR